MNMEHPIKTALISVSNKDHIVEFARSLHQRSITILSTGGSARLLREASIPVEEVSDHTGFPEIMDGRVKTLHPRIHGGILGRRGQDDAVMASNGIVPIGLVVVNLYPFESTVADPGCALTEAIEHIDIGGPAMLRAAAKNHTHVTVVVDHADYHRVLASMSANGGAVDDDMRFSLAIKAFEHTAQYDDAIANYLGRRSDSKGMMDLFPRTLNRQWHLRQRMRYGENPHQQAAFYVESEVQQGCVSSARQLQGKALSYNNIADLDAALTCVRQFDESPTCVIVKHTNPCGVAAAESLHLSYQRAYSTDPESAFGGVIACNRELDAATATEIVTQQFVEAIIAPSISEQALQVCSAKENIRLLACGQWSGEHQSLEYKQVQGGVLVQQSDGKLLDAMQVVTKRAPTQQENVDLGFALRIAKIVKSNAIVYARDERTIGVGAGQMSRVNSARIAAIKAEQAGLDMAGSVMASDAFFPFRDSLENAAAAGITAVIQPGGSKRDDEVIAAADEYGIAMVFSGLRHFKH